MASSSKASAQTRSQAVAPKAKKFKSMTAAEPASNNTMAAATTGLSQPGTGSTEQQVYGPAGRGFHVRSSSADLAQAAPVQNAPVEAYVPDLDSGIAFAFDHASMLSADAAYPMEVCQYSSTEYMDSDITAGTRMIALPELSSPLQSAQCISRVSHDAARDARMGPVRSLWLDEPDVPGQFSALGEIAFCSNVLTCVHDERQYPCGCSTPSS